MEALWRIVLSNRLSDGQYRRNLYDWGKRLAKHGLTPLLRMELREMLSPRLRISEGYQWREYEEDAESDHERVRRVINWEIVLEAQFVHSAIESFSSNNNWEAALPELLTDATDLLVEALDMLRELHETNDHSDLSFWQQPSISRHPQNRNYRDWTALIDLARDAWVASAQANPARAVREVYRWLDIRYPLFKRLAFFAAAQRLDLFPLDEIVAWLRSDDAFWLWASETQRETLRLIIAFAPRLPTHLSENVQNSILQGLPAEIIGNDREPEQTQRLEDREIWRRLSAFSAAGGVLIPRAAEKLEKLAAAHPQWQTLAERDEFPVWMGSGEDWRRYLATPKSRRELEIWLRDNPSADDLHREDDFAERCRSDFPRTLLALLSLVRSEEWIIDRWRQALQAWSDETLAPRSWRCLNGPLCGAPNHVIEALDHQLGYWLKSTVKVVGARIDRNGFFTLSRKLLDANRAKNYETASDPLSAAINHPVGYVTEAVLGLWYAQGLEDDQGLGAEFQSLFAEICDASVPSFQHGRILLCTHAITLYRVDKNWTVRYLLPQFDWSLSTSSARGAWTGFLWSPRLYWPLLTAIREAFLETAARYDELGDIGEQYVALMTFASLERGESFTNADFAKATAMLPARALPQVVQTLIYGIQGAGERKGEYWQNRIKPYIKYIWPKSLAARTGSVSEQFAQLIIAVGEDFPDALATLGSWLLPFKDSSYALHKLSESGLSRQFPDSALEFLSKTVPAQAPWSTTELRGCLAEIKLTQPRLAEDQRFVRLETIVRQSGLSI